MLERYNFISFASGAVHFSFLFVLAEGWVCGDLSSLTPRGNFNDLEHFSCI